MRQLRTELPDAVAIAAMFLAAACSGTSPEQAVAPAASTATVFEGARVIVGDGSAPIENAVLVVDSGSLWAGGRGAARCRCRRARLAST